MSKVHPPGWNATSPRVSYRPLIATEAGGSQREHVPAHPADLTLAVPPIITPCTRSNHPTGLQDKAVTGRAWLMWYWGPAELPLLWLCCIWSQGAKHIPPSRARTCLPRRRNIWEKHDIQNDPKRLSMLSWGLCKGAEMVNGKTRWSVKIFVLHLEEKKMDRKIGYSILRLQVVVSIFFSINTHIPPLSLFLWKWSTLILYSWLQ